MKKLSNINRKKFFLNIVIPTLLTQALFVILIFAVIIPNFRHNLIEAKKEMIMEIINTSISITDNYYEKANKGEIEFEAAKQQALDAIKSIRYGTANKDYIWIIDEKPVMLMHPYRKDLISKNLENFTDEKGNRMFVEMVEKVEKQGEGYVDYMWQWMDDSTRIVPKISYVKEYRKWNWIFGTGVYIEDVRNSIRSVINSLIWISLGIFIATTFLLVLIARRNLKVERQRTTAEESLKESNEKYKALVEASGDGTMMFVDNKCIYRNKKIDDLIDCSGNDELSPDLEKIIEDESGEDAGRIREFLNGSEDTLKLETKIRNKENQIINALIALSKINFSGSEGIIIIIKDLTPDPESPALNVIISDIMSNISRELNIGIFRATPGKKGSLTEVNNKFIDILDYDSEYAINKLNIFNLFEDSFERKKFVSYLNEYGYINDFECKIRKGNGDVAILNINAVVVLDENEEVESIDGFLTDITFKTKFDKDRSDLLTEFINQASLWDLNLSDLKTGEQISCSGDSTIKQAIELMDFHSVNELISGNNDHHYIISKEKIIELMRKHRNILDKKAIICSEIADPLVNDDITVIESLFKMINENRDHLIFNFNGKVKIIRITDILRLLESNTSLLDKRLKEAESLEEIIRIHDLLPLYIKYFVNAGTDIKIITSTITNVSDKISELIIPMAISRAGTPPCKFAFIALGSEGRSEQGLSTDQDNAIIYEDVENESFRKYFLELADIINNLLNTAGYQLCVGEIMANNPKWNQPLSVWKKYFKEWITVPEPQNLIDSAIFFDYRVIYGDDILLADLREYINELIRQNPAFIKQNAMLTADYKLPLGMFGKIQTEVNNAKHESFNLKNAIRLIVNTVRLYAMDHSINETNTLKRLESLAANRKIDHGFYLEIRYCFKFLMLLQLKYQSENFSHGLPAGNYLDLSILSDIELNNLKNVLGSISAFQSKVKYDHRITN